MSLDHIPVSSDIPQSLLNIEEKRRANRLPWNGQFSPQLVETLLRHYALKDSIVLDPFMGSGTVLYESGLFGLEAYAADVNPAAVLMARIYTLINVPPGIRTKSLERLSTILGHLVDAQPGGLFREGEPEPLQIELSRLASQAAGIDAILLNCLVVLSDFASHGFDTRQVTKTWNKLSDLVKSLPHSNRTICAFHCDARELALGSKSVDLVITSPPYINVYNYHQQYRVSTESLGWNLLDVARSEIGSNRKHRGNRFLTVAQYCLDITQTMLELLRVCKSNARLIFIVGRESNVRGVSFYNSDIVARLARDCLGCEILGRQERVFTNKFGQAIYEDLLHFAAKEERDHVAALICSRGIARQTLKQSLKHADATVAEDIEKALAAVDALASSPVLKSGMLQAA